MSEREYCKHRVTLKWCGYCYTELVVERDACWKRVQELEIEVSRLSNLVVHFKEARLMNSNQAYEDALRFIDKLKAERDQARDGWHDWEVKHREVTERVSSLQRDLEAVQKRCTEEAQLAIRFANALEQIQSGCSTAAKARGIAYTALDSASKDCKHEWTSMKTNCTCKLCGVDLRSEYSRVYPKGSMFTHELSAHVPQWAKDLVEREFPEENYGGIKGYFEGWPLRALFEHMAVLAVVEHERSKPSETAPAAVQPKTLELAENALLAWKLTAKTAGGAFRHVDAEAQEARKLFQQVLAWRANPANDGFPHELREKIQAWVVMRLASEDCDDSEESRPGDSKDG